MLFRRRTKAGFAEKLKALFWPRKGFLRPFQYFGIRILRLNATPHAIAAGVAAGVFCSWTPFIGLHLVLSFALSYVFAGNMIAAALGSAFGNPLTWPLLFAASWKIGSYMLGGGSAMSGITDLHHLYATLSVSELLHTIPILLLGSIPPALVTGILAYFIIYFAARAFQSRRRERMLQLHRDRMKRDDDGMLTV